MAIALVEDRIEVRYAVGDPRGSSASDPWLIADIAAAVAEVIVDGKIYTFPSINVTVYAGAYLKLLDSILIFTGTFAGAGSLTRSSTGWIQLGEKDVNNRYSKGCIVDMSQMTVGKIFSSTNIYDSYIIGGVNRRQTGIQAVNVENSKLSGQGTANSNITGNIKYLQISDTEYGLRPTAAFASADNAIFNGCTIGIWLYATTTAVTGMTFRNCKLTNSVRGIRQETLANNSTENTYIGVTFEGNITADVLNTMAGTTTQYTYSKMNMGEEFSITVTDSQGNKLNGALVTLKDKNGTIIFSELTDANGYYNQDVIRYIYLAERSAPTYATVNNNQDFNPFALTVSYEGKQTYEAKITISAKSDLQIMLGDEIAPVSYDVTGIKIADSLAINTVNGKLIMLI